jgi:hypothetical protein
MLKGGATVRASSTGIAESTFELTFQINQAGTVQFLVMYANMYARFMDTYVVFDNTVSTATQLLRECSLRGECTRSLLGWTGAAAVCVCLQ